MKINEVESRTGMARANIRYYEKEGLLTPARGENGYREYSVEDVSALEKVKLLRQLGLTVDTIRAVQRGETSLDDALAARQEELSREAEEAALARNLCAAIRGDHAGYADLEPERYRTRVSEAAAAVPVRTDVPVVHPWRRYFARALDTALYGLMWSVLAWRVYCLNASLHENVNQFMSIVTVTVLTFLLEPILLHFWGTTPGKWLMGISVRDRGGEKLSWRTALRRVGGVLIYGDGLNIPLVSIWRRYQSYRAYKNGEELPWEEESVVFFREGHAVRRGLGIAAAYVLLGALILGMNMRAYLPPHRGPITPEQFVENLDYVQKWYGLENEDLSEDGPVWYTLAVEDGVVTGVTLVDVRTDDVYQPQTESRLAVFYALAGTVENNSFLLQWGKIPRTVTGKTPDYTKRSNGVTAVQRTAADGYYYTFTGKQMSELTYWKTAEDGVFRLEFTVTLDN